MVPLERIPAQVRRRLDRSEDRGEDRHHHQAPALRHRAVGPHQAAAAVAAIADLSAAQAESERALDS